MLAITEDAHEDVLSGNVAVDDASDDDGWDGNTPDGLAHRHGVGSRQSRGGNIRTDIDVGDDGGDQVQRCVGDLEQSQSLGEVLGLLELVDDAEEAGVAG